MQTHVRGPHGARRVSDRIRTAISPVTTPLGNALDHITDGNAVLEQLARFGEIPALARRARRDSRCAVMEAREAAELARRRRTSAGVHRAVTADVRLYARDGDAGRDRTHGPGG